ncbi:unnamed protein product [Allacma fusca]|uniref:Reverse transcriptase domain-containing protein n=1 Tax=Allacma fusca TaxID=39272 RepID=A0A8J2KB98_9HEXA|nr:unnamed protein product [Allacma fusca]
MPFGISPAPENFQKKISRILNGLPAVQNHTDDWICWGSNVKEHDKRLRKYLKRLAEIKATLNLDKCEFGVLKVKFLGHIISEEGIQIDEHRVKAITSLPYPTDVPEVRIFVGLVMYLGQFLPNLSTTMKPLYDLLKRDTEFHWSENHKSAHSKVIKQLTSAPILAIFDLPKQTVVSSDASSSGTRGRAKTKTKCG